MGPMAISLFKLDHSQGEYPSHKGGLGDVFQRIGIGIGIVGSMFAIISAVVKWGCGDRPFTAPTFLVDGGEWNFPNFSWGCTGKSHLGSYVDAVPCCLW